ncbi:hypothetical protein I4U23_001860 [Adineta vaga]|nr:hypothetical protein I4U23_001860 [Adineta vaga]
MLEGQLLNDVLSRVEQSRFSYNSQTEEFRSLNTNFQTYLIDIKQIDDDNNRLQQSIEDIRTNYIQTLENHLKRLPEDFRQESHVLTEAHFERYKSKSRAKRFLNEREEIKKRINFLMNNEKEQSKRLNYLQRQDRIIQNELKSISEQFQSVHNHLEREKQIHQQTMNKVDQLHLKLEQVCVERSKTEFEVQNLREEVKLMQTAKEFLDDEYETILAVQTEANDYFLTCLNESILRIYDDFDQLNKRQMEQVEIEYEKMIKILEENSLANEMINETEMNRQRTSQVEFRKLQEEYQLMTEELTTLNGHNHILSERIVDMESDLYAIRNTHLRESINKENELQQSKMELDSLNEQLNQLTEYDRNLKFELTLYRGVLESEYRRKQQQQQPVRPTVLRTMAIRNNKTYPILTNHQQIELNGEKNDVQSSEPTLSTNDMKESPIAVSKNLSQEWKKSFDENQQSKTPTTPRQSPSEIPIAVTNETALPDQSESNNDGRTLLETITYLTSTLFGNEEDPNNANEPPKISSEDEKSTTNVPIDEELSLLTTSTTSMQPSKDEQISEEHEKAASISPETERSPSEYHSSFLTTQDEIQESSDNELTSPIHKQLNDEQIEMEDTSPSLSASLQEQTEPLEDYQPSYIDPTIKEEKSPTLSTDISSHDQPEENQDSTEASKLVVTSFAHEQTSNGQASTTDLSSPIQSDQQSPIEIATLDDHSCLYNQQAQQDASSSESTSFSSTVQQNSLAPSQEQSSSEHQQLSSLDDNVQAQTSFISTDEQQISNCIGDIPDANYVTESSDGYDNDFEPEEKTKSSSYETDNTEQDISHPSLQTIDEQDTSQSDKEETSSLDETHLQNDEPILEEQITCSSSNQIEEDSGIGFISSSGYYGTLNDCTHSLNQELKRPESSQASFTDVGDDNTGSMGEVDRSTSPKLEDKDSNETNELTLEVVMEDLRYVYRDLANEDDLVEINDHFPNQLTDRLEFGDNLIRILFDNFLTKYIVQPAALDIRSKTLDWIEFRDILFPILTGRYMERHIRKLFDLFDTSKDGYLSFEEIIDLFELLQVNNSTELARFMMNEFDKNQDDKLSIDEFVAIVKKTDDINNNILPEKLEIKSWFMQHPLNDENHAIQTISFEVPVINYPSKSNMNSAEMINNQITLLARIFKRVGADVENKQLDSNKSTLAMKLTNEFITNNINISNEDLYSFIELYLNKKQNSDCFIKWEEFRDIFRPFVNDGMVMKEDLSRWFDILKINPHETIEKEQVLHLLRLLQLSNPENILNKMNETAGIDANPNDSSTLEELLFAFDNTDETTARLYLNNEQIQNYDQQWLTKTIF